MTVTGVVPEQIAVGVPADDPADLLRTPYSWVSREYMRFVSMVANGTKFTTSQAVEAFHKFLAFADNAEEDENPVYPHAAKFVLQIISKNGIPVDDNSAPEIEHIRQFAKNELWRRAESN